MEDLIDDLIELLIDEYFYLITKATVTNFLFVTKASNNVYEKCARINFNVRRRILKTKKPVTIKMLRKSFMRNSNRNKAMDIQYKIVTNTNKNKIFC